MCGRVLKLILLYSLQSATHSIMESTFQLVELCFSALEKSEGDCDAAATALFEAHGDKYGDQNSLKLLAYTLKTGSSRLNEALKPKRRFRRKAAQVERAFHCPVGNCIKSYGELGALRNHMRIKHQSASKKYGNNNVLKKASDEAASRHSKSAVTVSKDPEPECKETQVQLPPVQNIERFLLEHPRMVWPVPFVHSGMEYFPLEHYRHPMYC